MKSGVRDFVILKTWRARFSDRTIKLTQLVTISFAKSDNFHGVLLFEFRLTKMMMRHLELLTNSVRIGRAGFYRLHYI